MSKRNTNKMELSVLPQFLDWQLANTERFQETFTLIFISSPEKPVAWEEMLLGQMRDSDMLFGGQGKEYTVLLMANSGETEAFIFMKRLAKMEERAYRIEAGILEVKNGSASVEKILEAGASTLKKAASEDGRTVYKTDSSFAKLEVQTVRVSIIDEDPLVTMVLEKLISRLDVEQLNLEIRLFHDGLSFIESDWHQSAHTHLVILNDVLPKKNGLDILHMLRGLPNTQKYYVFMMTKRKNELEMIFAFENGVDEYMTKPFNPRLFEAQIKKVLNRIYYE